MQNEELNFPRRFQMWTYTVGHGRLLLRSTKDELHPTRIDVLFKNVRAIHLPTTLGALFISEGTSAEIAELSVQPGSDRSEVGSTFIVRGIDFKGYVIAGAVAWHEDECEYDEPSHFSLAP